VTELKQSLVDEALSWWPEVRCHTCGGRISLTWKHSRDHDEVEIWAACHGMFCLLIVLPGDDLSSKLGGWVSFAQNMPEKVPEYDITDEMPTISAPTRFVISERSAKAARIGAIMQVGGVQGRVTGIDRNEHAIWLKP